MSIAFTPGPDPDEAAAAVAEKWKWFVAGGILGIVAGSPPSSSRWRPRSRSRC